jgi:vesicle-associated membrane protein 7
MESTKITNIQNNIENVKGMMANNIEQVMKRDEKLHLMIDKTDSLLQESEQFRNQSKTLKNNFCKQHYKTILISSITIIVIILFFIILSKSD